MRRLDDKRGLEMALTTVILIILSIAVLTVLIIFFNAQTGFLSRWFKANTDSNNVDTVISACNSLVTTESVYSYCCNKREVIFSESDREEFTCDEFRESNYSQDKIGKLSCEDVICRLE